MRKSGMHESVAKRVGPCPNCRSDRLTPVTDRRALCLTCRRCWEDCGDVMRWVSPARCQGCALEVLCAHPTGAGAIAVLSAPKRHRGNSRRRVSPGHQPEDAGFAVKPPSLPPTA